MRAAVICLAAVAMAACRGKQTFEQRVAADVARFNATEAHRRTDPVTTLDSLSFDPDTRTMGYHYTLDSLADDPQLMTDEVKDTHRQGLLSSLRASIQLRQHKEQGVTFEYTYLSRSTGDTIMHWLFTPADY